jgi:hypothetical protein
MLKTPSRYSPKTMISAPPTRLIHSRTASSTRPSTLAVAPSARKMRVKPAMKRREWTSAVRRALCTSSRLIPVMKVT